MKYADTIKCTFFSSVEYSSLVSFYCEEKEENEKKNKRAQGTDMGCESEPPMDERKIQTENTFKSYAKESTPLNSR